MKNLTVAFDVDGTILNNKDIILGTPSHLRPKQGMNLEVILLMQIFAKKMKNVTVVVWSGGGKEYAENIVRMYGLEKYVYRCYDKHDCDITIDIAFDDMHDCELADKNLVVRMK